jgi:hypothetical protein
MTVFAGLLTISGATMQTASGNNYIFRGNSTTGVGTDFSFQSFVTRSASSGTPRNTQLTTTFSPTSGSAAFTMLELTPTINQGIAVTGTTRGLYVNPTFTRSNDFRSIEIASSAVTMRASMTQAYSALLGQFTYSSSTATTISTSTNITLFTPASGANVTTSTSTALYIQATSSTASSGVVRDAIGALIYAPTGGTRNSALFTVGANYMSGLTGSTGAGSLCLDANGQVVYNSASDACLPSLRNTKHDITDLSVDAVSVLENLKPVSFVYNESDGRTRYGFLRRFLHF